MSNFDSCQILAIWVLTITFVAGVVLAMFALRERRHAKDLNKEIAVMRIQARVEAEQAAWRRVNADKDILIAALRASLKDREAEIDRMTKVLSLAQPNKKVAKLGKEK